LGNLFSKNLKFLREKKGISKNKLGEMVGVNQTTIGRWESEEITPSIDNVEEVAKVLNVGLPDLLIKDLSFDNGDLLEIDDTVQIPVLGIIKAGIPIEAQEEILEYVEIPKKWTFGGKKFYGLKISGDSMFPKYQEGDIVIFEQNEDKEMFNGKDCAVMVNGNDATFKKVLLNENGITLIPYNTAKYEMMIYSNHDIENLPIKIIGIAKEKRTKL
jgi:repressor LexA